MQSSFRQILRVPEVLRICYNMHMDTRALHDRYALGPEAIMLQAYASDKALVPLL